MEGVVEWLESTRLHEAFSTVAWVIPAVQTIHILAVAIVMGSVLMIGLRVMQVAGAGQSMAAVVRRFAPWIWASLAVLLTTGLILIVAEPPRELYNILFWTKMALVLAGVVVTIRFQSSVRRNAAFWEQEVSKRRSTVLFALLTFLLWIAIAFTGRWIAYLENVSFLPQSIFN